MVGRNEIGVRTGLRGGPWQTLRQELVQMGVRGYRELLQVQVPFHSHLDLPTQSGMSLEILTQRQLLVSVETTKV